MMREVIDRVEEWRQQGRRVALATVVKTWGSSPRPLGAKMALTADGDMVGSVSGGCVEGAVCEEGQQVLSTGVARLLHFGITDDQAWTVGLSCGGEIEVFVEPLAGIHRETRRTMRAEIYRSLTACLEDRELVVLATVVEGPGQGRQMLIWPRGETLGDLGSPRLNQRAALFAEQIASSFQSSRKAFDQDGDTVDVFFDLHPPPPELLVVGAVHVAVPLIDLARTLGFRTIVIDPRRAFATADRFPHADEIRTSWPGEALAEIGLHAASYVAALSHDLKIDLPALETAMRSPARYIGALGSKKTHAKRVAALEEKGFAAEEIARIHAPIGLDLGGRRAAEIALAIMAEMVAATHGRASGGHVGRAP